MKTVWVKRHHLRNVKSGVKRRRDFVWMVLDAHGLILRHDSVICRDYILGKFGEDVDFKIAHWVNEQMVKVFNRQFENDLFETYCQQCRGESILEFVERRLYDELQRQDKVQCVNPDLGDDISDYNNWVGYFLRDVGEIGSVKRLLKTSI